MPPWATQEADVDVVCSLHQRVADVYPIAELDVIVVGIFHQVCQEGNLVRGCICAWDELCGCRARLRSATCCASLMTH